MKERTNDFHLNYNFYNSGKSNEANLFSLKIADQDFYYNAVILKALVGTLFKFTTSGKNEPYLAESFSCSEDKRVWKFKIRSGLTCEDGTEINAYTYLSSLKRLFQIYQKSSSVMIFDTLKGYEAFKSGRTENIEGLYVDDQKSLVMEFTKAPEDLTEFLNISHFGFWCEANFEEENFTFVSSGAYSLVKNESDAKRITLKVRSNWPLVEPYAPRTISFDSFFDASGLNEAKNSIFDTKSNEIPKMQSSDRLIHIKGLPYLKTSLILNTKTEPFFKEIKNRRALRDKIMQTNKNRDSVSPSDAFFYPLAESQIKNDGPNEFSFNDGEKPTLTFAINYNKTSASDERVQLLQDALAEDGIKIINQYRTGDLKTWNRDRRELVKFSGAFGTVRSGAKISKEVINMMFCTKLGVQYPDPSGRICKLINEYLDKTIDQDFINQFNQIIYEDAAVIPIESISYYWLLTPDLDPTSINPSMDLPLFEQFKLK